MDVRLQSHQNLLMLNGRLELLLQGIRRRAGEDTVDDGGGRDMVYHEEEMLIEEGSSDDSDDEEESEGEMDASSGMSDSEVSDSEWHGKGGLISLFSSTCVWRFSWHKSKLWWLHLSLLRLEDFTNVSWVHNHRKKKKGKMQPALEDGLEFPAQRKCDTIL